MALHSQLQSKCFRHTSSEKGQNGDSGDRCGTMNLQSQLQSPYSRDAWLALLRDLFGHSAGIFKRPVPVADASLSTLFIRVLHLGDLKTADGKTAALLDIEVVPGLSLPRNRAGIRHLAARLIDGNERVAILAAFHTPTASDWRFSFIIREKSFDIATGETLTHETPARRFTYLLGPNEKCRTAAERFATLQGTTVTLTAIEEAFKVDKLTKEFYGELSDWYFWALTQVKFPDDIEKDEEKRNATMTIRLITRLMFVWFLKKKGLIPDCLFDKTTIDEWLNNSDATGSTYYKAVLQNLFFATLNFDPKEGKREFVEWGKKGVLAYRYKRFFRRGAAELFLDVCKGIPFLNGGLFENLDKYTETESPRRLDCFSNAKENEKRLVVPDDLFFAKGKIVDLSAFYGDKKKSAVKVKGLFEILNAYNFTVEENTPYDQDVALDPELLGHVFENLLASYNPETRTTARKQTGSFYTPREIVQYMVDESLIAYLKQTVGHGLEEEYRKLTRYTDEPITLNDDQKSAIMHALLTCKILDPACGSGAFPMGVLQQMVHILNRIDPDNTYLKAQALKQIEKETRAVVNSASSLDDKIEKMRETLRLFDETTTRPDYARKLLLIENNIFGVDIQPVAVQIAKLRFFISLVVEQNDKNDIRPLPNLETNFVAADALIGIAKPDNTLFSSDEQVTAIEHDLKANRHRHFFARTMHTKRTCRKEDKRLRDALQQRLVELATKPDETVIAENLALIKKLEDDRSNYLAEKWEKRERQEQEDLFGSTKPEQQTLPLRVDINKAKRDKIDCDIRHCRARIAAEHAKATNNAFTREAEKLAAWDPYDQNATSPFFDPEWMFNITGGFDIVIGNPPYINFSKNKAEGNKYKQHRFSCFDSNGDIYYLFYERGYYLLKKNGHLCFITSKTWMRTGAGESLRTFLAKNTDPQLVIDFVGQQIFESATVNTNIILFTKQENHRGTRACVAGPESRTNLSYFVQRNSAHQPFNTSKSWVILNPIEQSIKAKMEKIGTPLKDWDISINYGIKTGFNGPLKDGGCFIITDWKREEILSNCATADERKRTDELIRPILRGRDIKRYSYEWAHLYIISTFPSLNIDIEKYPSVKTHLLSFGMERLEQTGRTYTINGEKITARKKTHNKWFETQDQIGYWEDFSKPKIVWGNLSLSAAFAAAPDDMYINAPCSMIVPFSGYLLAILNSRLGDWYIRQNGVTRNGGYFEYKPMFVERLPVPVIGHSKEAVFSELSVQPDRTKQRKVDAMVYDLYGLSKDEIAFIEQNR